MRTIFVIFSSFSPPPKKRILGSYIFGDSTPYLICCAVARPGVGSQGEVGSSPRIIIWEAESMATLAVIQGFHTRAVVQLDFDVTGRQLVSVGQDSQHSIAGQSRTGPFYPPAQL